MNNWLLDSIKERRGTALKASSKEQVYQELLFKAADVDTELIQEVANALELASLDLILERFEEDEKKEKLLCRAAGDGFRLFKTLPIPGDGLDHGMLLLRASALAILGDRGADAGRWLRELEKDGKWPKLPLTSNDWGKRTWATIIDVWLRLIRKHGWTDRDLVLQHINNLRENQKKYERDYLDHTRVRTHNQKVTVAARRTAEWKMCEQRS